MFNKNESNEPDAEPRAGPTKQYFQEKSVIAFVAKKYSEKF